MHKSFCGKKIWLGCLILWGCFFSQVYGRDGEAVEMLVARAKVLGLAQDSYWHVLYHYHKPFWGGTRSRIDHEGFFVSPEGKTDPQAEMDAVIRLLFSGKVENLCPYIARYHWLHAQLGAESGSFPEPRCAEIEDIQPSSARLVFPTYYMNSPASMFGHTLLTLRLDNTSRMLDKAVNYSAFTQETNGFVFAFKGIFGFYSGYFNVLPYYKKMQEYGEINQRDIWEYRLDLKPHEMEAMVRHIREMEGVDSDYYFFDENCSFTLMYTVEAARPGLRITESFPLWVIPVDTVRALEREGLIAEAEYRPSRATIIRHRLSLLSPEDQALALQILEGKEPPERVMDLPEEDAVRVLDTVIDCIRYRFVKRKMELDAYQKTLMATLRVRSRLGGADALPPVQEPRRPETLHASGRFSMGVQGVEGRAAMTLSWRPAFTDLTDPDYPEHDGIRIVFGETRLRLGPEGEGANLESLDVIDIVSLSPRNRFFTPLSWAAGVGIEGIPGEEQGRLMRLSGGVGFSWAGGRTGLFYLLAMPRLFVGGDLDSGYSLGLVGRGGWIFRLFEQSKWQVFTEGGASGLGHEGRMLAFGVEGSLRLHENLHLGVSVMHQDRWGSSDLRTLGELRWFH